MSDWTDLQPRKRETRYTVSLRLGPDAWRKLVAAATRRRLSPPRLALAIVHAAIEGAFAEIEQLVGEAE